MPVLGIVVSGTGQVFPRKQNISHFTETIVYFTEILPVNSVFIYGKTKINIMKVVVQQSEEALKVFRLLSNLTIKNIINYLKENGPSPPSQIARGVDISPSTSSRCLQDLRKYNIVRAKWETKSVEERPLKVYTLVPNILRYEFVLHVPKKTPIKNDHSILFKGAHLVDVKEDDKKVVYVSMDDTPFRFEGARGDIIKEIAKGGYTYKDLADKFKDEGFDSHLKHLITLGLVEVTQARS